MAHVVLSARAFGDLERTFESIGVSDPARAREAADRIPDAVLILEVHPMMGRQIEDGHRELVMGRGTEACRALYRWAPALEVVLVLAVRNARDSGYQGE